MSSTIGKDVLSKAAGWRWRQYLAAFTVNIIAMASGAAFGWATTMLPLLQSQDSPIGIPPISDAEASWIASIGTLSRLVAIPAYMYSHDRLGRKMTSYLTAIPSIASWAMLLSANSVVLLLCARFLYGVASAGTCLLVPSYLSDIAEDDNKGQLGALYGLSLDIGLTFSYAMGSYTTFTVYHTCCLLLPLLFAAAMFWLPESPVFLLIEGKQEEAEKALRWLRNGQASKFEMDRLRTRAEDTLNKRQTKLSLSDVTERSTIRGILINVSLTFARHLCGISVLLTYTVIIFRESGSSIQSNVATIVTGVLVTTGSLLSSLIVERSGRRPLLISSLICMNISHISLGTYFYLKNLGWRLDYVGWLPLACLSLCNFVEGISLNPLPSTIVNETVSVHARGAVQSLCNFIGALLSFAMLMTYSLLVGAVGQYGCFWLYSGACVIGAVSTFLTLPETKNRSLEDVIEQLKSDHYISSILRKRKDSVKVTGVIAE